MLPNLAEDPGWDILPCLICRVRSGGGEGAATCCAVSVMSYRLYSEVMLSFPFVRWFGFVLLLWLAVPPCSKDVPPCQCPPGRERGNHSLPGGGQAAPHCSSILKISKGN